MDEYYGESDGEDQSDSSSSSQFQHYYTTTTTTDNTLHKKRKLRVRRATDATDAGAVYYIVPASTNSSRKHPKSRQRKSSQQSSKRHNSSKRKSRSLPLRHQRKRMVPKKPTTHQMFLLNSNTIPDDSSEPEPSSPDAGSVPDFIHEPQSASTAEGASPVPFGSQTMPSKMRNHRTPRASYSSTPPPPVNSRTSRGNILNQTVPAPSLNRASQRSIHASSANRSEEYVPQQRNNPKRRKKYVPPPRPIGPIMIRRNSHGNSRPIIISAAPMGRNTYKSKPVRRRRKLKKPVRYRKLKRTDIRKSRLEGELQRTSEHLEDLKLALKVYNTLDNQDQQKLVDDIVFIPQRQHKRVTGNPSKRSQSDRRANWTNDTQHRMHPYDFADMDDFGEYEEDEEDQIDDIEDPHIYSNRAMGVLQEQPMRRRGTIHSAHHGTLNIFSPRRAQKNLAPPPADTDSESSQVYMYDDDNISEYYQELMNREEEESAASLSVSNEQPVIRRQSGNEMTNKYSAAKMSQTGGPNNNSSDRITLEMMRGTVRPGEEQNISQTSNTATENGTIPPPSDDDLDDEEEDEDGIPFDGSDTEQKELQIFDHDNIGEDTIYQELKHLIQQFEGNLGFLFVVLRELRNVNDYGSRLQCLKFFETLKVQEEDQTSAMPLSALNPSELSDIESAPQENSRNTPTIVRKKRARSQSLSSTEETTSDSDTSETTSSAPIHSTNSSLSVMHDHHPSASEISQIAKQMPDEETSEDDDDEDEEDIDEEETSSNGSNNEDDAADSDDDEEDVDEQETSSNSSSDLDSETAKSKNLLESLNLKLISLVYDRKSSKPNYTSRFLTQLSRDILLTVSRFVPTATVELLESLHDTVMNYSGQVIVSCRDDLIQDVLDMLYDETVFNRLVSNIDSSYKEDIAAMKNRLHSLKKQRKEDIEKLKHDRLARLKAGNPYPHTVAGQQSQSSLPNSPSQRFNHQQGMSQNSIFNITNNSPPLITNAPPLQQSQDHDQTNLNMESYSSIDRSSQSHTPSTPTHQSGLHQQYAEEDEFDYSTDEDAQHPSDPERFSNPTTTRTHDRVKEEKPAKRSGRSPQPRQSQLNSVSPSRKRGANQPLNSSHLSASELVDEFSEISNQATFDLSSDFDYSETEDPINLANEVLFREEMRRSQASQSRDESSEIISIDDLPSNLSNDIHNRGRESLEKPMLVSPEEENGENLEATEDVGRVTPPAVNERNGRHAVAATSEHQNGSDITDDVKQYVNLVGNSRDSLPSEFVIPTPEQHASFSIGQGIEIGQFSERGSPVMSQEFAKSLQILTEKYAPRGNR